MNLKSILTRLADFSSRHRTAITVALFVCIVMQQCTIFGLRQELSFVKQKYEQPAIPTSSASAQQLVIEEVTADEVVATTDEVASAEEGVSANTIFVVVLLVVAVTYYFLSKEQGWYPFNVRVSGKIWQDLSRRVVFTLNIGNKSKRNVQIDEAMIEFMGIRDSRKFRIPVGDFPLTLSASTKHTVNISLQKLLERDPQLLSYKAIRASVLAGGKRIKTMPIGVRWK